MTLDELLEKRGQEVDVPVYRCGQLLIDAVNRIHSLQGRVEELTRERDKLSHKIHCMSASLDFKDGEIREIVKQLDASHSENSALNARIHHLEDSLSTEDKDNDALYRENERLTRELKELHDNLSKTNNELLRCRTNEIKKSSVLAWAELPCVEPTREQRRFEAASKILAAVSTWQGRLDKHDAHNRCLMAVRYADALLAELAKPSHQQMADKIIKRFAEHPEKLAELLDRIENDEVVEWEPAKPNPPSPACPSCETCGNYLSDCECPSAEPPTEEWRIDESCSYETEYKWIITAVPTREFGEFKITDTDRPLVERIVRLLNWDANREEG